MNLIIHTGTGTIIDLDECRYVPSNILALHEAVGHELDETELVNVSVPATELSRLYANQRFSMTFAPEIIRAEAEGAQYTNITDAQREWLLNEATEEEIATISDYAIWDERLWELFPRIIEDAIEEVRPA